MVGGKMSTGLISGNINVDGSLKRGYIFYNIENGIIDDIKYEGDFNRKDDIDFSFSYSDEYIISAGDFNAHSHPEQSIYVNKVDRDWNLYTWCKNTIYKYSTALTPEDIYYGSLRAFTRMLLLGVTSVMVSFYCHNKRGNELDKEVLHAADTAGIRLYFGRMNYDIINEDAYDEKRNSQVSYFESPEMAAENFIKLMNENKNINIEISPSVHSIHASSKKAIISAINLGNKYNKFVQFHLSEDKNDVQLSKKLYGLSPVEFLVSLVWDKQVETLENVILSDCIWITDNERKLIKDYDMNVVLNPRMNSIMKTGDANLLKMLNEAIEPYLGTDGEASNNDLSITGEREFLNKRFPNIPQGRIQMIGRKPFKFGNGYIGDIKAGNLCDLKVSKSGKITDVFVGGKIVVKDGKLLNIDINKDVEVPLKNKGF
jgi:cytosine/adenosine deaminase-related metal-dependent hydrolase